MLLEVVDDPPVAERDRLEQRAVDLGRRASAASGRRSRRSGRRRRGSCGCRSTSRARPARSRPGAIAAAALLERLVAAGVGPERLDEPGEHVADRDLTGLVAVQAGEDPVPDDAGDPRQPDLVAGRRPCRRSRCRRPSRTCPALDAGAGHRHERVDVADRDRDRDPAARARPRARAAASRRACRAARTRVPSFSAGPVEARVGGLEVLASAAAPRSADHIAL